MTIYGSEGMEERGVVGQGGGGAVSDGLYLEFCW